MSQTWSREVLQLCCHQDFAHIPNTHSPLPPGLSDSFYTLPLIWKTASPHKPRGPSSEGNIWKANSRQGSQPCLPQQHRFHLIQEALIKVLLWFEKQCRQILGNSKSFVIQKNLRTYSLNNPVHALPDTWQASPTTSFFTAGTGHLPRRSCRCNKHHPGFKRFTAVTVS